MSILFISIFQECFNMTQSENQVFNLFANCLPVKGYKRSVICDVYRERFRIIPNSLYFILTQLKNNSVKEVKEYFKNENDQFIDEYFDFMQKNEFGFFCTKEEQKLFPKLNTTFEMPSIITNCIIDIDVKSSHDYSKLFSELEELHCHYWQIRFYSNFGLEEIEKILWLAKDIHLHSISLLIPYQVSMTENDILRFYNLYPISRIDFYSVPESLIASFSEVFINQPFNFHEKDIIYEKHCGVVNEYYFTPNVKLYSESQQKNSCLNQKISVDVNGEIKNCPSMMKSYGNIKNTSLLQALEKENFKSVWSISKSRIKVCKDCEFRHICTDCRAYIDDPNDIYSKPLKCGYDPYRTKWEEWSTNPLKKEAISYYGMQNIN